MEFKRLVTVASCNLSQWALDFEGNYNRIVKSIELAKLAGARIRVGCELEIPGYGCEDHFLELDIYTHCWEVIFNLLENNLTNDILCDIGMPVIHKSVAYNCRILLLNKKILLIRPKHCMANGDNYRESRYFSPWKKEKILEDFILPISIAEISNQKTVKIGLAILDCEGVTVGIELCEELWVPYSSNIDLGLNGVDIICNGSGSYFELNKYEYRIDLIRMASRKVGGIYIFSNQQGCDGGRLFFDGGGVIFLNGQLIQQAQRFSMNEIETICATFDLQDIYSYRIGKPALSEQNSQNPHSFQIINTGFSLVDKGFYFKPSDSKVLRTYTYIEEINLSLTSWLWDYLRRSNASGFFLPLSGGADSSTVATLVASMCHRLFDELLKENKFVISELERILHLKRSNDNFPNSIKDLCQYFLYTCYMGTEHSSKNTLQLSCNLSKQIGSTHTNIYIDKVIKAFIKIFFSVTGKTPTFQQFGGTIQEDLALQNIQARIRMIFSYLFASLLPWVNGRSGWLLVIGTGNADECLRGYLTKYDCSSGDINPLGSLSKSDINSYLSWASSKFGYTKLQEIRDQIPTAELRPIQNNQISSHHTQNDEQEMGFTYEELNIFSKLRKIKRYGPVSMFLYLLDEWNNLNTAEISSKVINFFSFYGKNRHKMTTMTPSCHINQSSPDDNRHDHRPFLYPSPLTWQYNKIKILSSLYSNDN